jgi:DNA-binding MarR family transcriptional regulator
MLTTNHTAKYFLLTKATQAVRKLVSYYNQELSPLGITAPQMIALGVLCFQDDLSLGEFAFQMKIRKATAVSMIKRLETMGLVTKEAHPQDARLNVLNITEKTRKLIPKIQHKVAELENTIGDQIGASSLERIVRDFSMFIDVDLLKKDD